MGDCLLTASFLSYAGAFTHDYRRLMTYDTYLADVTERGAPPPASAPSAPPPLSSPPAPEALLPELETGNRKPET